MKLLIPLMLIWISSCSSLSKKCKYSGTIEEKRGALPVACRYNENLLHRVPIGMDAKDSDKFSTYPVGNL